MLSMKHNERLFLSILIIATLIVSIRAFYESRFPQDLHGAKARFIAIPSTGPDIKSPVSYLFGRAPFYIICDRAKRSYKSVKNKYVDAQHAAGLRASRMVADMKVDVVCANNIGFEPFRIFKDANIDVYTDIKPTVWETLKAYPDSLVMINAQNVPAHFGITGSKKNVNCSSFNVNANAAQIVQGEFYVCSKCGYNVPERKMPSSFHGACPICANKMQQVIAVAAPSGTGNLKPKIKVF